MIIKKWNLFISRNTGYIALCKSWWDILYIVYMYIHTRIHIWKKPVYAVLTKYSGFARSHWKPWKADVRYDCVSNICAIMCGCSHEYDCVREKRHQCTDRPEPMSRMLWSVAVFVFVFPALAAANEEILDRGRQNASSSAHRTIAVNDSSSQNAYDGAPRRTLQDTLPGPWVADMFHRALANFTIHEDVGTSDCQKQTQMYIRHLKNNSYWAVKSEYYSVHRRYHYIRH